MMMLRMLNHTHTYNYWYRLHYYWLSHYWLRYYWFSHYLLRQYLLWQLLFLITFIVLLILSQPITCGYDNDSSFLYDNYILLLEMGSNSYVLFMNGFCYSYSCQAEVWTMLEELKCFVNLLFLNMNCDYFWKCLLFTSILSTMNLYTLFELFWNWIF
jgi:hypothetical protein